MPGPQFAHIQTWSKKPNKVGQSIDQVIDEATRIPEFSTHVLSPEPPRILLGNPHTFRAEHQAHVTARSTVVQKADGSILTRAIRSDRHTMASIVMSYPVPRRAIDTEAQQDALARWERRNIAWLQERYGDQLKVVLAHDDEEYPHLHAWLLSDDPSADATTLHPGKVAKKAAEALAKDEGHEPREAVKLGNRALKEAMTAWQDDYYEHVAALEGLTRSGPKRRRLTREQWKAEKATAVAHAVSFEKASNIEERDVDLAARHEKFDEMVALQRAELKRMRAELTVQVSEAHTEIEREKLLLDQRQALISERENKVEKQIGIIRSATDVIFQATDWLAEHLGVTMPEKLMARLQAIKDVISPPKETPQEPDLPVL